MGGNEGAAGCQKLTSPYVHRFDIYLKFEFLDDVVALKRLKMEKEKQGFPITALREIKYHIYLITLYFDKVLLNIST